MSIEKGSDTVDDGCQRPSWVDASQHAMDSVLAANNAMFAAMGFTTVADSKSADAEAADAEAVDADGSPIVELSFGADDWTMERSATDREELGVGDAVRFSKSLDEEDVSTFARVSGDTNRLHLDDEFAAGTRFAGRISHGTLVAGTISAALARFPGVTIYLSQDLTFHGPVGVGETVTAECEIVEVLGDDQYRVSTTVYDESGTMAVDGEAVILLGEHPES